MATNINTILSWFKAGLKPTQAQFWASWSSFWHKDEMIPQSSILDLTMVLNAKVEKDQFDAHKTDMAAHAVLFDSKEDKNNKGVADGYVPLDEIVKISSQYLSIIDDLVTGGSNNLLSAEQGKILKTQITAINTLLTSNDINLDTVQELVDAIKTVQTSLSSILVNDLTTGGTTKALTAEMGKTLKTLYDTLSANKVEKGGYNGTAQELKNGIDNIYQPDAVIRSITPTRVGNVFTYPANEYEYLLSKTHIINAVDFVTTINPATDDYKRVDLIYGKSDNTLAKLVGVESLTVAIRPEAPVGTIAISFINVFGATIELPTPISREISVQDSIGTEKFKIIDYVRFKGASFNATAKQIEIDPIVPLSAFLDIVNGSDLIATLGNANKPFKTLEKLISSLPATTGETYTIYMLGGIVNVNRKLPVRNLNWVSYTGTTLDFTNCMNSDGITHAAYTLASLGNLSTWTFLGSNISIKCTYVGMKTFAYGGEESNIIIKGTIDILNWQSAHGASWNGSICPYMGSDFTVEKMYDSPQVNTAFCITGTSRESKIRIKTLYVEFARSLTRTYVGEFIIDSIVQIGSSGLNWQMHQNLSSNVRQSFKNINFIGTISPKVELCVFDNSVLSTFCTISVIGTGIVTGKVTSSTYLSDNYRGSYLLFQNFTGKVNNILITGGGVVTFENCNIEVDDYVASRYTDSAVVNCISFKGFNTINRTAPTSLGLFRAHQHNNPNNIMPINIGINGTLKTNSNTYGKDVSYQNLDSTFKEKLNEVIIRSKTDLINKVLSSTTTYIIDGIITLITGEYIQVPAGGLTLVGYGFDVSRVEKNVPGQSIFISPVGGSGNFVTSNIQYNSGLGSVFDIVDSDGSHAIELNDVNFQSCAALGIINHYRQFTATTCGIYGCSDGFTLEGSWNGFKMVNTNAFSFGASGTLIKKGATTSFANRLYLDLNLSLPIGAKICDFQDSNFVSDKLLQVVNCLVKVNGVIDPSTTNATFPNISPFSAKSYFTNNIGVKNSFNEPYGLKTTNLSTYANDTAAAAGNVQVGEVYVEITTGYFKTRLV
jgi:hypothetical protein